MAALGRMRTHIRSGLGLPGPGMRIVIVQPILEFGEKNAFIRLKDVTVVGNMDNIRERL